MEKVFVYGSLLTGLGNHRLLSRGFHGSVISYGADRMIWPGEMLSLGAFPGLIKKDQLSTIIGEVYEVDEETFERLDNLEGYPSFYDREQRRTKNGHLVWVYFLNSPERDFYKGEAVVEDGDWRKYLCG